MLKGARTKTGKKIDELTVGERIHLVETIEDKDLLLYLGLTNDSNPLYIQHEYAKETAFKKPIVPPIMLNGIVTSAISKYFAANAANLSRRTLDWHIISDYRFKDCPWQLQNVFILPQALISLYAIILF